jgi:hypothetical protein
MVAHESDFRNDRQAAPRPVAVSNETSRHVCLRWESWGRYAPAVPADEAHEHRLTLIGIAALVKAWDGLQRVLDPASDLEPSGRVAPARFANDPDKLHVVVRLTAQIQDAAPVTSDRDDFGISMPRRAGGSELYDAINQMLGRDPEQHRPPRLSWGQLIEALANVGVSVTEQELIDAPLTIELSPEVKAQLADAGPWPDLSSASDRLRHCRLGYRL